MFVPPQTSNAIVAEKIKAMRPIEGQDFISWIFSYVFHGKTQWMLTLLYQPFRGMISLFISAPILVGWHTWLLLT